MSVHNFDLTGLRFRQVRPDILQPVDWANLQTLGTLALTQAHPNRTPAQIDFANCNDDPDTFRQTRLNPNLLVGTQAFGDHQLISEPRLALAYAGGPEENRLIGYAAAARVTVGGKTQVRARRLWQRATGFGGGLWLRDVMVDPAYKGRGVGHGLVHTIMNDPQFQVMSKVNKVFSYTAADNKTGQNFAQAHAMTARETYGTPLFGQDDEILTRWIGNRDDVTDSFIKRAKAAGYPPHALKSNLMMTVKDKSGRLLITTNKR